MKTITFSEPLELRALGRCDVTTDTEDADLRFDVYDVAGRYAEMELKWGQSPRQRRTYRLGNDDLWDLHDWLTKVLGLVEDE